MRPDKKINKCVFIKTIPFKIEKNEVLQHRNQANFCFLV